MGDRNGGLVYDPGRCTGAFASNTVTLPLFEPERFSRDAGGPDVAVRTFVIPTIKGSFTLALENGSAAGDSLASAAVVKVNGFTVIKVSDLNQQVTYLERDLAPYVNKGENVLEVEVRSIPSSYITISINGVYLLDVQVTEPAVGSSLDANKATVQGMWEAYTDDVGIEVDGVPADLSGQFFVASNIPLVTGTNTLTATIATFEYITVTATVEVTTTGESPSVELSSNINSGVPPLTVSFSPDVRGIEAVEYRYDLDGNGTVDETRTTDSSVQFTYTYMGVFTAEVVVVDVGGIERTGFTTVTVQDRTVADALFTGRWNDFRGELSNSDIEGAVDKFSPYSADRYQKIFTTIQSALPQMAADMADIEIIYVKGDSAKYRLRREENGQLVTYYLYFMRDPDGIWRIHKF
ncbi:MAG: hypothetical protein P1S46_07520 [bacterium]|nr:hypothetical protein [bacterium]